MNSLKNKLIPRDKGKGTCSSDDKSFPPDAVVNSPHKKEPIMMDLISSASLENNGSKVVPPLPIMVTCKQEDANSAKSDVLDDSDSPHCTDGNNHHSSFVEEPADSSHAFEPADQSDFSQDEEDNNNLSESLLTLPCLPKVEDACYHEPPENTTCSFGFPVEDQPFCFWPY